MRLLFAFILLTSLSVTGQNNQESTSTVLKRISSSWMGDSLAVNGFRFKSYNEVLKSKIDSVTRDLLFAKCGKPNQIKSTNHGPEYWYYVYDTTKLAKKLKGFDILYLIFLFDPGTGLLKEIDQNVMP